MDGRAGLPCGTLVIGYGNDLRGDDAAGVFAASRLADAAPGQRTIVTPQLTPDLAADIAQAERVVFVDAYPADHREAPLRVEKVQADGPSVRSPLAHRSDPEELVALARQLFGTMPEAWVVGIPAFCFDVGERMSSRTAHWVDEAVALIEGSAFFSE